LVEFVGDAAQLFDPSSEHSIRHALTRMLREQDLRAELVKRGFRRAAAFVPEKVVPRLLEAVREAGRPPP
jgi:hypothetical protein